MGAAVMRNGAIVVDDVPAPVPQAGEVLVKILACGICGSDLHVLQHIAEREIDVDPLITGRLGVSGVARAFTDLSNPEAHAKILVEPWHE